MYIYGISRVQKKHVDSDLVMSFFKVIQEIEFKEFLVDVKARLKTKDLRKDRVSNGEVGRSYGNGKSISEVPPSLGAGGRPYGGLPQQFGPIVITLESSPASAPSRRRKAGPISTLPIE